MAGLLDFDIDPLTGMPIKRAPDLKQEPISLDPSIEGYRPSWRESLAGWMMGDERPSVARYNFVTGLLGTSGTPGSERLNVADFTPAGMAFAGNEFARAKDTGDALGAVQAAAGMIPGAKPAAGAAKSAASQVIRRSTELPAIREMPVNDAIAVARKEPHLIKSGDQSEGFYIGSPREIQSKRGLTNKRNEFDAYVAADARGGDWYDRYRNSVAEVTGNDPKQNLWMSNLQGQMSAGVDPGSELAFSIKENNSALAGMPVKAARPAQHEAFLKALAENNPYAMQLGDKTGEYARLVNPDQGRPAGATGVNDFRHARNWGYTEASGEAQRDALTQAQHKFLDYETALAVDRANKAQLAGRSNWTGEQLQAAPWVRQKAYAILDQRPNMVQARMKEAQAMLENGYGTNSGKQPTVEQLARELAYEDAFPIANRTIGDFFDKHTAFATYEAQPGPSTRHLSGSMNASEADRAAFANDPRSTWANAPGNRDAIYSGLTVGDTGAGMRVRPTQKMQGLYQPPGGLLETNPGEVARPLVAFDALEGGTKALPAFDRAMLNAGEATRAYIDAQDAGAAHKVWQGGRAKDSNSLFIPQNGPATKEQLLAVQNAAKKYGLGDVVDTGQGLTVTQFYPGAPDMKNPKGLLTDITAASPTTGKAERVKVDSIYQDFVDSWKQPEGSGNATRQLLKELNVTPQIREAFDKNPYIAQNALARLERDEAWSKQWGATRQDIQNARRIIGEGPGWVSRLDEALKKGMVLPAVAGAVLLGASASQDRGE